MHTTPVLVSVLVALTLSACTSDSASPGDVAPGSTPVSSESAPPPVTSKPTTTPSPTAKTSPTAKPPSGVVFDNVDAPGAAALLEGGGEVVILDIRTPAEFAAGYLKNAVNIDYRAPGFAEEVGKLGKGEHYLVHCRSGGRSTASLETFKQLGFTHVTHLDGGILAWEKAGKPVEK